MNGAVATARDPDPFIFDEAPSLYDRYRPGYPAEAVDALVELTRLTPGSRALEIGAGTGQLTLPLISRGLAITALEPGRRLAAYLARKVGASPAVSIVALRLEDFEAAPGSFDAVVAATAFHWVDPRQRYRLAARALRAGGSIGLIRNDHALSSRSEPYYRGAVPIYEELARGLGPPYMPPAENSIRGSGEEIEASDEFDLVAERQFGWDAAYTSSMLDGLLRTYSNHRALPRARRSALLRRLRAFVDRELGGVFVDRYVTTVSVGRRVAARDNGPGDGGRR